MKSNKMNSKIIIAIIIVLIIFSILSFFRKFNEKKDIVNALNSIGCKFIEINTSREKDFKKDIFASIPHKPVDSTIHSNQQYYENMIKVLSIQIKNQNFRIIDEEKEIVVAVKNENGELKYTINGNNNFYETEMAKISKSISNETITSLNVKSEELEALIQNDWKIAKVREKLGTKEKIKGEYECYVDEGYSVRTVNLKVFNIVFNNQYKNEIFEGITTGLENKEIVEKLGEPVFQSDEKQEIGYKTKDLYVFFYNGEVSIYRVEKIDEKDNEEFAKLVTQLLENKNFNEFITKVTDIYPEFNKFNKNTNEIEILYSLRGFAINYNDNGKQGITIYKNYSGKITNDIDSSELGTNESLPSGIYYFDIDSVYQNELKRENL